MINGRPHVETGFPILSLRRRHLSASAIFYGRIQLQAKLAVMGAPAARELWESAAVSSLLLGRGGGLGLGEASINGEGRQNRGGGVVFLSVCWLQAARQLGLFPLNPPNAKSVMDGWLRGGGCPVCSAPLSLLYWTFIGD